MITWFDDKRFAIDDINFTIDVNPGPNRRLSTDKDFTIVKTKSYLNYYAKADENYKYILELGLFEGGSLVFLDKIYKPEKMVGIDIKADKIGALENYIRHRSTHIKTYYNSSQDDETLLKNIVSKDLDGKLDLVVDDASHAYDLTKKSFSTLFPLLNPGGSYIIEDWAWSHRENSQSSNHPWYKKPALTNLIFDIIIEMASNKEIEDIYINNNLARIKKTNNSTFENIFERKNLRKRQLSLI